MVHALSLGAAHGVGAENGLSGGGRARAGSNNSASTKGSSSMLTN